LGKVLRIALAGNANVGKSTFFNQLTGLAQHVGNWPGKTVEKAEGTVRLDGYTVKLLDLPGTYSLSAYSEEELVAREYIAVERPDVVIDIVDATAFERNLYLTIHLIELGAPLVVALNFMDEAAKKGIEIDVKKLSKLLGVPVVPMVAASGKGVKEALVEAVKVATGEVKVKPLKIEYGKEVEDLVKRLEHEVSEKLPKSPYPARWIALKLLEKDEEVQRSVAKESQGEAILTLASLLAEELERLHGESSSVVIAAERYSLIGRITKEVQTIKAQPIITFSDKLDVLTSHRVYGYLVLIGVLAGVLTLVLTVGNYLGSLLEPILNLYLITGLEALMVEAAVLSPVKSIVLGLANGFTAGLVLVIPYIVPFYIALYLLEDAGYLPRAAFLMDSLMHKLGVHGKGFIPLILGYGCNVPACISCKIMETERERFILGFLVPLIPCAARTIVILTLVGKYIGIHIALLLYLFNLALVFAVGRMVNRLLPGEPVGLIMEVPPYRAPKPKVFLAKAAVRIKEFILIALPLLMVGSAVVELLATSGWLTVAEQLLHPPIKALFNLPKETIIPLVFGVLRKELAVAMLAEAAGTMNFIEVLTLKQMVVFTLLTMLYVPCVATIAALLHGYGARRTALIVATNLALGTTVGVAANLLLTVKPL